MTTRAFSVASVALWLIPKLRFTGITAVLLLATACVYYNGMYNTRHYTSEAERAEREGRRIDASSAWGQVVVRAETLLARHPTSKYIPRRRS